MAAPRRGVYTCGKPMQKSITPLLLALAASFCASPAPAFDQINPMFDKHWPAIGSVTDPSAIATGANGAINVASQLGQGFDSGYFQSGVNVPTRYCTGAGACYPAGSAQYNAAAQRSQAPDAAGASTTVSPKGPVAAQTRFSPRQGTPGTSSPLNPNLALPSRTAQSDFSPAPAPPSGAGMSPEEIAAVVSPFVSQIAVNVSGIPTAQSLQASSGGQGSPRSVSFQLGGGPTLNTLPQGVDRMNAVANQALGGLSGDQTDSLSVPSNHSPARATANSR